MSKVVIKIRSDLSSDSGEYSYGPVLAAVRVAAREQRYTGTAGIKEFCKEEYNATLRTNQYGDWTSLTFNTSNGYDKFCRDFIFEILRRTA